MKKAQIKLGENVAIMIIFFIILVFALVYFFKLSKISATQEQVKNNLLESVKIAEKAMNLPELQCSVANIPIDNCVDRSKFNAFSKLYNSSVTTKAYYYDILGYSKITIKEIWPEGPEKLLYERLPDKIRSEHVSRIPILILDPSKGPKYFNFGIMTTTYYP